MQQATIDRWTASCRTPAAAITEAEEAFNGTKELAEQFRTELTRSQERRETLMRR